MEAESREKFERDMIELQKANTLNEGSIQIATWTKGDLRRLRDPVKRKGSASTAAATSSAPHKSGGGGRHQPPNLDGSIASVSVKKEAPK